MSNRFRTGTAALDKKEEKLCCLSHICIHTMTITLYHGFPFRGTRCAWLVHELGFDPAQEDSPIKFHKMSLHAPPETIADYKQNVHPYGTIPALIIDEDGKQQTILESAAICLYLAQRFNNGMLPSAEESANYYNVSSNITRQMKAL